MTDIEERIMDDIISVVKDNLRILIRNNDTCLYRTKKYYEEAEERKWIIDQENLTRFTEEALYALLNADFLYDFRDIE